MKQFMFGAAVLAIIAGVAYAQDNAANPPPPADNQTMNNDDNGQQQGGGQGWWGKHRHGGRGMHGPMQGRMDMMGQGGPSPMGGPGMMATMMNHQGFHLELGNGVGVHVMCGQADMKDCIASAQPLIDAAKAAAAVQPQTKAQ